MPTRTASEPTRPAPVRKRVAADAGFTLIELLIVLARRHVVKRLKSKGLLQRKRTKEDARAYAVKLTEEGRKVLRTAEPLAKRVDERILDALPAKRRAEFMSALASIIGALEAPAAA